MKRNFWLLAIVLPLVWIVAGSAVQPAAAAEVRLLTGQVMGRDNVPLPNAVVYLKNTRTLTVKTFITGDNGNYRFPALSPNADYEIYADYNGKKSETKTLSSFDSRAHATINLRIDTAK